jgi:hypothetical protein
MIVRIDGASGFRMDGLEAGSLRLIWHHAVLDHHTGADKRVPFVAGICLDVGELWM